jgi:hypothetical protein
MRDAVDSTKQTPKTTAAILGNALEWFFSLSRATLASGTAADRSHYEA